jgi:excisionase family DNA binding protein
MMEAGAFTGKDSEVMDYNDLAAYLKITAGTLRHWVMKKRIPFYKVGAHVRFSRKKIEKWLEDCEQGLQMSGGKGSV